MLPPPDYALYVQFPEGHNLDPDLCNIDVTEENLVLNLHKDPDCKGQWESFKAGPGEENLEVNYTTAEITLNQDHFHFKLAGL